jgi:hypothetical protein
MHVGHAVADRFEIERFAASGGMGKVYRAYDRQTGRAVALKVVRCEEPDDEMRFTREALVLADLDHPAIVHYVAHGFTIAGESYLAMEWLEGEDLDARLRRSGLTVGESLTLGRTVASALAALHARGVIHRDVKPSNLFLPDGAIQAVKLLDFGLAHGRGSTGSATQRGALMGTLGYMAPERVRGMAVDARADVFSLGCVLFECLTGRPAFAAAHMAAVLGKILFEDPPPVSEICRGVPGEFEDLVARMLSKNASVRPPDGTAVAAELAAMRISTTSPRAVLRESSPSLTGQELCLVSVIAAGDAPALDRPEPNAPIEPLSPRLRATVAPFGAQLEDLDGGLVIATLTGTANAADQAERAARCAIAMRSALGDIPIAMAIGRGHLGRRLPIGEAIDRAIQLLRDRAGDRPGRAALADRAIAVDEVTGGLLEARFEVTANGPNLELLGEHDVTVDSARLLLGKPTPCVGREREIEALSALLEDCVTEPAARAALVTGVAGTGKSRLRHEFLRDARRRSSTGTEVWIARADATRCGTPLSVLSQLVRCATGLHDGEPIEASWDKLRARVARRVAPLDVPRITEVLGEILGAKSTFEELPDPSATLDGAIPRGDVMRRAFVDFIAAEVAAHPVVIVLEDLHWSDRPSVTFIDTALRILRHMPLFVLALARTEVYDVFPRLWLDRGVQEIRLEALPRKACQKLVRTVLGEAVTKSTVDRVVTQSGGNALYLEELIRAVASGKGDALPETVLLMAQARLSALEPEARRVLRAASIFGDVFWSGGVRALLGDDASACETEACLMALAQRELIQPRTASAFADETEYAFRHALIREAALAMLTAEDRVLGHRLASEWLSLAGKRGSRSPRPG